MKLLPENKREWQNALLIDVTFPIFLIEGLIWCIIFGILNIGPYTEYCFIRLIGLWWVTLPLEVILLAAALGKCIIPAFGKYTTLWLVNTLSFGLIQGKVFLPPPAP